MDTVMGVFSQRAEADRAAAGLVRIGIPRDRITVLAPGLAARDIPTDEGERSGIGATLGAVVGGASGAALGLPLGAVMTLLVPGVGAVIVSGLIGAVLLGAGGAVAGSALEGALVTGLPRDELFVYEDALRQGHVLVAAVLDDADLAARARQMLGAAGAETIDAARERWWLGLRSAEQERYPAGGHAFERDEALYRRGFEAALGLDVRGRSWAEAALVLRGRHGADVDAPAFRHGWDRGQTYRRALGFGTGLRKSA